MVYEFKDNSLLIKENGCRIFQNINTKTKKPFVDKKEALEWVKENLIHLGVFVEAIFDKKDKSFQVKKGKSKDLEDLTYVIHIRNLDDDSDILNEEVELKDINKKFIEEKLKDLNVDKYYIDLKILGGYCFLEKEEMIFSKN